MQQYSSHLMLIETSVGIVTNQNMQPEVPSPPPPTLNERLTSLVFTHDY
jgi:hypothetical protein